MQIVILLWLQLLKSCFDKILLKNKKHVQNIIEQIGVILMINNFAAVLLGLIKLTN